MLAESIWQSAFGMPQIAIIMGTLVPIVAIVATQWSKVQSHRSDNELKRDMLDRGMDAEEIERIMGARTKGE